MHLVVTALIVLTDGVEGSREPSNVGTESGTPSPSTS